MDIITNIITHSTLNVLAIILYIVAMFTGIRRMSLVQKAPRFQVAALVFSISTSFCFALLLTDWLLVKSESTMQLQLALAFESTHLLSAIAITLFHIWIAKIHEGVK